MAAEKPTRAARRPQLDFKLELSCNCRPPICAHAGPGIARLLTAAYAKGRSDGARETAQKISRVVSGPRVTGRGESATIRVSQKGSKRTQ
jgi:hypothetical protein